MLLTCSAADTIPDCGAVRKPIGRGHVVILLVSYVVLLRVHRLLATVRQGARDHHPAPLLLVLYSVNECRDGGHLRRLGLLKAIGVRANAGAAA